MNFRTLHDMSHYFAPMNHYDFNKHMSIYGNGNNGLGYHPNGVFIGGKLNRDEQWEKDDMKNDIRQLQHILANPDEYEEDEYEDAEQDLERLIPRYEELRKLRDLDERHLNEEEEANVPTLLEILKHIDYEKPDNYEMKTYKTRDERDEIETFNSILDDIKDAQADKNNLTDHDLKNLNNNEEILKQMVRKYPYLLEEVHKERLLLEPPVGKPLKKSETHSEEFLSHFKEQEEYLKNLEKPVLYPDVLFNEWIKRTSNEVLDKYDNIKKEYNDPEVYNPKIVRTFPELPDNDNFELSYIPLKTTKGLEFKIVDTGKTKNGQKIFNNDIYYNMDIYQPPLLKDCDHLNTLLYSLLDKDEYDKMINGGAKISMYINSDCDIYENGKLIFKRDGNAFYDNIVYIKYIDNDGIERESKFAIENKYFANPSSINKSNYVYKDIIETNETVELSILENVILKVKKFEEIIEDLKEEKEEFIALKTKNKKLNIIDDIARIENEIKNADKEIKKLEKQDIKPKFEKTIKMGITKTGLKLNEEFKHKPTSKASELHYKKIEQNISANTVPKFNKKTGKIKGMTNKWGEDIDKPNFEPFIGCRVLFDIAMMDREIGINYSKMIKDKKINPDEPLETHPLEQSAYSKKKFNSLGFGQSESKILIKPKIKINKSKFKH